MFGRFKLGKKVFFSIILTSILIASAALVVVRSFYLNQLRQSYIQRYQTLSRVIGDTLFQVERASETLMKNAAQVVADEDRRLGILSNEALKALTSKLGVTHIFVIDKEGTFIRSTNEDPKLIPNLFSFCDNYRKLLNGQSSFEFTPIIPPEPEPNPYKFLSVPSYDKRRIIEVGIEAAFIGKTLTEALKKDSNVLELSLFAPDGTSLGNFSANKASVDIDLSKDSSKSKFANSDAIVESKDVFEFTSEIESDQRICCQCDNAGISKDRNYYYILKAKVSKKELLSLGKRANEVWWLILASAVAIGLIMANYFSKKITGKVRVAEERIKEIMSSGDLNGRVSLKGNDEIAYLTNCFDSLLEQLSVATRKIISSEKQAVFNDLASQVSHDIRSPLSALNTIMSQLGQIPEDKRIVIRNSVNRINDISNQLLEKSRSLGGEYHSANEIFASLDKDLSLSPQLISPLIDSILSEKRILLGEKHNIDLEGTLNISYGLFSNVNALELKRVVSNLINNSIEALPNECGKISVSICDELETVRISIKDNGVGISKEILPKLGKQGASFGKKNPNSGNGLGLHHAKKTIRNFRGRLEIESEVNKGTTITILLPKVETPGWFVEKICLYSGGIVVSLDDDPSVHGIWVNRFQKLPTESKITHLSFTSGNEFKDWFSDYQMRFTGNKYKQNLFLVDFELLNQSQSGLDIVEELGISNQTILVTSRYDEEKVRIRCERLNIKLIPKSMTGLVPVEVVATDSP